MAQEQAQEQLFYKISHIEHPYENAVKDPAGSTAVAVGVPVGVIPNTHKIESLRPFFDEYRTKPERRVGSVALSAESFMEYVKRYHNKETSVVFREYGEHGFFIIKKIAYFTAVFNYHPSGPDDKQAGFGDFGAECRADQAQEFAIIDAMRDLGIPVWERAA